MGIRVPIVVDGAAVAADKRFLEAYVLCGGDYLCANALSGVVDGGSVVKMVEHKDIDMVAAEVDLDRLRRSRWREFAELARSIGLASLEASDPETAARVLVSSLLALRAILTGNAQAAETNIRGVLDDLFNTRMIMSGFTDVEVDGVAGRLSVQIASVEQMDEHRVVVSVTLSNADVKLSTAAQLGEDNLMQASRASGFTITVNIGIGSYVVVTVYDDDGRYSVGYTVVYTSVDAGREEEVKTAAALAARLAAAILRGDEPEARRIYNELRSIGDTSVYLLREER